MLRLLSCRRAGNDEHSKVERLAAENARLRSENTALRATTAEQGATITALRATSATVLERIATLERLVADLQATFGGQPGHAGNARALAPIEHFDVVKDIRPICCADCGRLQLQRRDVFGYLTEAGDAHFHGQPAPSILPLTSGAETAG